MGKQRVYILGMDGYLGWALYNYLTERGHEVRGCDNYMRRQLADSLVPTRRDPQLIDAVDVANYPKLKATLEFFQPDVVVHFAELPSAPYSMMGPAQCVQTQGNNVLGSLCVLWAVKKACPNAHLIKLGTMGEYCPSSWYHMSKVLDTHNCRYACELWGLSITDVMQGPVYGVGGRFDYDEVWGTVINRWVAMAVKGHDLLVYGDGQQVRGFLPIQDSLRCFEIAMQNPAGAGEHRVINQYAVKHPLLELAKQVSGLAGVGVELVPNPRVERVNYEGDCPNDWLTSKGYKPTTDTVAVFLEMLETVRPYKDQIDESKFYPQVRW